MMADDTEKPVSQVFYSIAETGFGARFGFDDILSEHAAAIAERATLDVQRDVDRESKRRESLESYRREFS